MKNKYSYVSTDDVKIEPNLFSNLKFNKVAKDEQGNFLQISKQDNKYNLIVTAPITHAGKINKNDRFYQPRRMKQGAVTFTSPFPRPILLNHNDSSDPIGRVIEAVYEPIQHPFIQDAVEDFNESATFEIIQYLMKTGLLFNDEFPGLGHIIATMSITDQDAIAKFMDLRYLSFSTSQSTNRILCPHTGKPFKPWWDDEEEDDAEKYSPYNPYEEVNGMPGFVVFDTLSYLENSVATIPADELAIVREMHFAKEGIKSQDTKKKECLDYYQVNGECVINLTDTIQTKDAEMTKKKKQESNKNEPVNDTDELQSKKEEVKFMIITDDSKSEEIYKAIEEQLILSQKKESILSMDKINKLDGSSFIGPNRTFPATDMNSLNAIKVVLDNSTLKDSTKSKIQTALARKEKQFTQVVMSDTDMLDSFLKKSNMLSDYDLNIAIEELLTVADKRQWGASDVAGLDLFIDSTVNKTQLLVQGKQIKELDEEKKELQTTVDSLLSKVKSYSSSALVLAKTFKDNAKIESLDAAIEELKVKDLQDIEKELKSIFEDKKLTIKMVDYLNGFTVEEGSDNDNETIEDPTLKSQHAKTNVETNSLLIAVKDTFNDIKTKHSMSEAEEYIHQMTTLKYITSEEANAILKKED